MSSTSYVELAGPVAAQASRIAEIAAEVAELGADWV
jgi:hypothetical protein